MTREFSEFARRSDPEMDLLEGALLIAREAHPGLDPEKYREKLDRLAAAGPRGSLGRFNEFFFRELNFRGNREDYYDPANSHLNLVIDRRVGIPITLSIVYCHVAANLGYRAAGIGFPGRYLVRCATKLVDCFDGRLIDRDECQEILDSLYGGALRLTDDMLRPAGNRDTLARVLNNLKGVYLAKQDFVAARRIIRMAAQLVPGSPEHSRDQGVILIRTGKLSRGLDQLEKYLKLVPHAPDSDSVREQIRLARKLLVNLN